jgi:hypothetical protein
MIMLEDLFAVRSAGDATPVDGMPAQPVVLARVIIRADDGEDTERFSVCFPPEAPLPAGGDPGPFAARRAGWSSHALHLLALCGLLIVAAGVFTASFGVWYGLPIIPLVLAAAVRMLQSRTEWTYSLSEEGRTFFVEHLPEDAAWEQNERSLFASAPLARLLGVPWGAWMLAGAVLGPFTTLVGIMGGALLTASVAFVPEEDGELDPPSRRVRQWIAAGSMLVFTVIADFLLFRGLTPAGLALLGLVWLAPRVWREFIRDNVSWRFEMAPGRKELLSPGLGSIAGAAMCACFALGNVLESSAGRALFYTLAAVLLMLVLVTVPVREPGDDAADEAPESSGGAIAVGEQVAAALPAPIDELLSAGHPLRTPAAVAVNVERRPGA